MADEKLLMHVADIVGAHVSRNSVSVRDVPALIQSVHASLAGLAQTHSPEPAPEFKALGPAVPIRSSVKPDSIACLECGLRFKMIKRHIRTDHGLSVLEYRTKWKLPSDYPMVAESYSAHRKALAIIMGLGRKSPNETPLPEQEH